RAARTAHSHAAGTASHRSSHGLTPVSPLPDPGLATARPPVSPRPDPGLATASPDHPDLRAAEPRSYSAKPRSSRVWMVLSLRNLVMNGPSIPQAVGRRGGPGGMGSVRVRRSNGGQQAGRSALVGVVAHVAQMNWI